MDKSNHPVQASNPKKWQRLASDLSPAIKTNSDSTAGGESITKLVKKVSRSFSAKTTNLFKKSSAGRSSEDSSSSIFGSTQKGGSGCFTTESFGQTAPYDYNPAPRPVASSEDGPSSVRFSTCPSKSGSQRSRNISGMLKTCRKRLSIGSLRDEIDEMGNPTKKRFSPIVARSSSGAPRLGALSYEGTGPDGEDSMFTFRNDLDRAMKEITERGKMDDYIKVEDSPNPFRYSKNLTVRGKPLAFSRATNVLGNIVNQKPRSVSQNELIICKNSENAFKDFDFGIRSDFTARASSYGKLTAASSGGKGASEDKVQKAFNERNEILESAKKELAKSSPQTAKFVGQVRDMPLEARDKNLTVPGGIRARVKLSYPWIQLTNGRLEVFDTREAALGSIKYEMHAVNDLAFYNVDTKTYFLQPPCYLIDSEYAEVGRIRGLELVSLSYEAGTAKHNAAADASDASVPIAGRPYLKMNTTGEDGYVIVDVVDDSMSIDFRGF